MLNLLKLIIPSFIIVISSISCVKGCVDKNAINYEPSATANRGCIYPEIANIIAIQLSSHPISDLFGNDWDVNSPADKFFKIINNDTDEVLYTTEVEGFSPTSWIIEPNVSVNAEDIDLRFELYDRDDSVDVLMDKATLVLTNFVGKTVSSTANDFYPETSILIGKQNSIIALTINWTE